jgi:hypothetical protein
MLSNYVELTDVNGYGYQLDDDDAPVVQKIIPRCARVFDLVAEVAPGYFGAAAEAPALKTFFGDGSAYLRLDPYVGELADGAVTTLDGYTVPEFYERTDRWKNPFLHARASGRVVTLLDEAAWFGGALSGGSNWSEGQPYKVSARWGFEATPDDVVEAVLELIIAVHRSKDPAFAKVIRLEDKTIITQALPDRTKLVAEKYARRAAPEVSI